MADLGDSGEVLRYLTGFWAFVFSPRYRARRLANWQGATPGGLGVRSPADPVLLRPRG